ncbi:hypothetical protein BJX70DRAFT_313637 [Aspergillus crustosus]
MADTAVTLPLLRRTITCKSALEEEENILLELDYPEQRIDFFVSLYSRREAVQNIASYHLGQACQLGEVSEWLHGSFNVCIPLYIGNAKRAIIRFPLPYKVGEFTHPGNVDEKLRCEAATFIWLQQNCPDVPIPRLWAFGLVGGNSFTTPQRVSFPTRALWYLKRCMEWLSGSILPCPYVPSRRSALLDSGYLIMDYVGDSEVQMLSDSWDDQRDDRTKRTNLFKGLSRVILSLSQVPLPRIGSWTLDPGGVLRLSNRPLTLRLHQLENAHIPSNISRDLTYSSSEAYYHDQLSCHDSRIRHQPNSVSDEDDGRAQMARLTLMRALLPHFLDRSHREGPFLYRLTDLHPSNIFLDSNWHIKCVIDLEWASSLPAETLRVPDLQTYTPAISFSIATGTSNA